MKRIYVLAMIALLAACKKEETKTTETAVKAPRQIEKAAWLAGSWGFTTPEGTLTEKWVKVNDSVYHGESNFVTPENKTTFSETVVLDEIGGKMAYTVTTKNDTATTRFDLTKITDTEITFENPQHDYPNKIVYTRVKPDSLVAVIYGKENGKEKSETFPMKKLD